MKVNTDLSPKLQRHLGKEHHVSPWSEFLKEIVYGGNDGIVTTFAVVAGFAGAGGNQAVVGYSSLTVLLFGLANLFADGASMGLGNFLSLRSEKDLYRNHAKKELLEIQHNPAMEKEETVEILMTKGYNESDAEKFANLLMKNEKYWLTFMMRDELEMEDPVYTNAYLTALATFLSFLAFGFIPLIPYIFLTLNHNTFLYSVSSTFTALLLLGILRWKITRENIVRSIGEVLLVGGISAGIAYAIGTFFKG